MAKPVISKTDDNEIRDEGDLRKYFFQVPNMVDDLPLSLIAFRLYAHLKRVAGDYGACWQSTKTLAEACFMGMATISKAKNELIKAGLIRVTLHKTVHGGKDYHRITITNVWQRNLEHAAEIEKEEKPTSPREVANTSSEVATSPREINKNQVNNNQLTVNGVNGPNGPTPPVELPELQPPPPLPPSKKKSKTESKPHDPLLENQAVKIYRNFARYTPNPIQREVIARTVQDFDLWGAVVQGWLLHGWKPTNVDGMLSAYQAGGIQPVTNGQTNGNMRKLTGANGEEIWVPA